MKSKVLKAFGIGFLIGIIGFLAVKFIPRTDFYKNLKAKSGGEITAVELVNKYTENEALADSLYVNKQIVIKGKVSSTTTENDATVVNLASADSSTFVAVTLKPKQTVPAQGQEIIIKGICAGKLSDVQITEGEIVDNK
ncbi:MAG: OB-fold protein [Chitinophagaceae bacterium]